MLIILLATADEWKKFGLYFAFYIFQKLQKRRYLDTFQKLVRAIKMLLGPSVSSRDLDDAERLLKEFLREYEV